MLGKEEGAGLGAGLRGVCLLLPILLTEDAWAGACADMLLLEVLPCLLATRLA